MDMPRTGARRALLLAVGVSLLASPASAKRDPLAVWDDATIVRALEEAEKALEEELGGKPAKRPRVILSSRKYFEEIGYAALGRIQGSDLPPRTRRIQAQILSRSTFGFYEAGKNTVHIIPENFADRATRDKAFGEIGFLRMVLAHELVHAWDEQRYKMLARAEKTTEIEPYLIWGAVIEGHAQWVTERALDRIGAKQDFLRFTQVAFSPPPDLSDVERAYAESAMRQPRFSYVVGHEFFRGLEGSDRKETIVDDVFAKPPASVSVVLHPSRYLLPPDPPPRLDLYPALTKALAAELPGWKIVRIPWDEYIVRTRFNLLPEKQVDGVLDQWVAGAAIAAHAPKGTAAAGCSADLLADDEMAAGYYELALANGKARSDSLQDLFGGLVAAEVLKDGPLRPGSKMSHNRRVVMIGDLKGRGDTMYEITFAAGDAVVACSFSGGKREDAALEALITRLRAAVVPPPAR